MGLDFDAAEYCKTLKNEQLPPYKCPKCEKKWYKSVSGLQYHLVHYDHENAAPLSPVRPIYTPARKKGRARPVSSSGHVPVMTNTPKEALVYAEAQQIVQFDMDGISVRLSVCDEVPIISLDEYNKKAEKGEYPPYIAPVVEPHIMLPEASVKELANYTICDAPPRPTAYIRFIEKSAEELDGEVEYDVDEEDTTWLAIINEKRKLQGLNPVSVDSLELLMDRLEKESYFQAAANGQGGAVVDDDAVCCICMDGECQNTNVILFCDMCNLAVHQDCYGVPYIPEGQWLCRRCLQSPSRPVDCVLCPNTGGAFKQTDRGQWAHVVCALWIPEVRFANTVFLEPIDSIETIPAARWRLTCYVCKQKSVGACIQCHRNNCYAAFHVTCAQHAGLHMRMDTVRDNITGNETQPVIVQKTAFCDAHTPASLIPEGSLSGDWGKVREESRNKMKQARKMLAKKRTSVPVILIPTIPPERIQEIGMLVNLQKKAQFIQRLIAYWTLKRQYRNGVPLLRRLQSQGQSHGSRVGIEGSPDTNELLKQLKYWQCLRQDLERARLLCELVRKREKLKVVLTKTAEQCVLMQLNPLESAMGKLLDTLVAKDMSEIFTEPVDTTEVPDYTDIVKHPMDLSTMRLKLKAGFYQTLDEMFSDFELMIRNCLAYNNKDTVFYRAGVRMRDQGVALFANVRTELENAGLVLTQKADNLIVDEIDSELKELATAAPSEAVLTKLFVVLDMAQRLKHSVSKTKRVKQIRSEIGKIKKSIGKATVATQNPMTPAANVDGSVAGGSHSDVETKPDVNVMIQTPPCSPLKHASMSASPSGVNRRTAVLFTRKAQAALKKPEITVREDFSCDIPLPDKQPKSPRKVGRSKRANHQKPHADLGDTPNVMRKKSAGSPKKPVGDQIDELDTIPDSFRVYRAQQEHDVDSDSDESNQSFTGSTCSSCSSFSGSRSDLESSFGEGPFGSESDEAMSSDGMDESSSFKQGDPATMNPLQLVWAKCRGYPWYPALIIDPQIPKGFVYNGVPLPAPPADVLALRKNNNETVFLVLFFDAKRTWQWLPSTKLELLGMDKEVDQAKLVESRKPAERKAVKKAYQDALQYQSQVSSVKEQSK